MTYIDKTASINNINLMYNACKGILRVKYAGLFDDLYGEKKKKSKKSKNPLRNELILDRLSDFSPLYTDNADFQSFVRDVFGKDALGNAYIDVPSMFKDLGSKATFGNVMDFYDKYRDDNSYRPDWLLGRTYDPSHRAKKGILFDRYFKKFLPPVAADATPTITGDSVFSDLSTADRQALITNILNADKSGDKRKANELIRYLQYAPKARLKDLAYNYFQPEDDRRKAYKATHGVLKGEDLGTRGTTKLRGYRPGVKVEETGEIAHPVTYKDFKKDKDYEDIFTPSEMAKTYNEFGDSTGMPPRDFSGIQSDFAANIPLSRGKGNPIRNHKYFKTNRAANNRRALLLGGAGALGVGTLGYNLATAYANSKGWDKDGADRWKRYISQGVGALGGAALGGLGGATASHYLNYYE